MTKALIAVVTCTGPVNNQSDGEGIMKPTLPAGLLKESGRGGIVVIRCIPLGVSTKLQRTVLSPQLHAWPWLNSMGQEIKDDINGKRTNKEEEGWTGVGGR